MDNERIERMCEKIREENLAVLEAFEVWLEAKGLSEKTFAKHVNNVDFYINEFLLYEDARCPAEGVHDVSMFLGYWFIRKAMWASESSIRSNTASLKKFYAFMVERGEVDAEDLANLKQVCKEEMAGWLRRLRRYDDPDVADWMGLGIEF